MESAKLFKLTHQFLQLHGSLINARVGVFIYWIGKLYYYRFLEAMRSYCVGLRTPTVSSFAYYLLSFGLLSGVLFFGVAVRLGADSFFGVGSCGFLAWYLFFCWVFVWCLGCGNFCPQWDLLVRHSVWSTSTKWWPVFSHSLTSVFLD